MSNGISNRRTSCDAFHEAIEGFSAAIEQRRADHRSCVNVVLSGADLRQRIFKGKPMGSEEQKLYLESVGLYFGLLSGMKLNSDFIKHVSNSIGSGPLDLVKKRGLPTVVEVGADENKNVSVNESDGDRAAAVRCQRIRPPQEDATSEPRLNMRDNCVVS